jgi:hypothetical protein
MPILPGLIANSGGSQPSPPRNLSFSSITTSSFTLNWLEPVFIGKISPVRYVISLYDSSGSLINASYKTINYPATTISVDGLSEGTTYSAKIKLENSVGIFSDLSASSGNVTTAVTPPPPPPPPDPGNCPAAGTVLFQTECDGAFIYRSIADGNCGFYNDSVFCGTVPPGEPTCTASCGSYGSYGSCQNGTQYRTRTCTRTDCSTYTQTQSRSCCTPTCGAWGPWKSAGVGGILERFRTCINADCTTRTETEVRCNNTGETSRTCGPCSRTRPLRRTCTVTIRNSDCSTSTATVTESCT